MTDRPTMTRTIIMCAPDNYILAVRAVKSLLDRSGEKEMLVAFDDVSIFVRRNQKSVTALQVKP